MKRTRTLRVSRDFFEAMEDMRHREQQILRRPISMIELSEMMAMNRLLPPASAAICRQKRR